MTEQHLCPVCGKPAEEGFIYCSLSCASKEVHVSHLSIYRPCPVCGKPIKGYYNKKYCSVECRDKAFESSRGSRNGVYESVLEMRTKNPCATLQTIGDKVGVSRERVRQILKRDGLKTKATSKRKVYLCLNCGKELDGQRKKFCSRTCQYEYGHPLVECVECHKLFRVRIAQLLRYERSFCSRECHGRWMGKKFGKGKDTKHYRSISDLYLQGVPYKSISEQLNIPYTTILSVMRILHTKHYLPYINNRRHK